MKRVLILLVVLMTSTVLGKGKFSPDKSLVYKTVGKTELKVHMFYPQGHKMSDKRPAIIFFFGGGWVTGNPRQFYQQARAFADLGFVAMSADYRVIKRHKTTPFECVKDGKSAIRWIRQNTQTLGVDPNQVIAAGGSAGGHVAACTGVIKGYEEDGEDLSVSSLPNAMILYNPVIDTTEKGYGLDKLGEARKTDISPCHHVKTGIPPTLTVHGTVDKIVPFENVQRFHDLMKKAGNQSILVPFEGKDHGFFNGSFFRRRNGDKDFNEIMKSCVKFVEELGYIID